MKLRYGVLLSVAAFCFGLTTPAKAQTAQPTITVTKLSQTGKVTLQISNPTKERLRLWGDSNSWGAARWRILKIGNGQVDVFFQNPHRVFTRNLPTTVEIAPGETIERVLEVNAGNWCGLGYCSSYNQRGLGGKEIKFEMNETIAVIYDVPPTKESQDLGVWYGVVAAVAVVK